MRRTSFLIPVVAIALLAGCGGAEERSATKLAALTSQGVQVDYTPLASPREAVAEGDLIVRGTVIDVVDGIAVTYTDPLDTERQAGGYATYVLAVDEVLSGDASKLRDRRAYVTVYKSRTTAVDDLARANSRPSVVAVLDDISTWKPTADATVDRPAAVPAGAPLFFAYNDGLWLQDAGAAEMTGAYAERSELPAAWNSPQTVAELAAALRAAK